MRRNRLLVPAAWIVIGVPLVAGCLAAPPSAAFEVRDALVRGESEGEAREVADMLVRLRPALLELVPDSELDDELEVWVQEEPHLYHFPQEASFEAEGLYAPAHDRILLSRNAEDIERVLAHELAHAALGASWSRLPGTLEEGLCDSIATRLVPQGGARLRAGRLSSAALACGGLELDLDVRQREELEAGVQLGWSARISLTSEEHTPDAHLDVFEVSAGLSSTRIRGKVKRSYYGLSFLVIERIVDRHGLVGLQELCARAVDKGHRRVPRSWLLKAAELGKDAEDWRLAAEEGLGVPELVELVRMYPDFIADAIAQHLRGLDLGGDPRDWLDAVDADLRLGGGHATLPVMELEFLRSAVLARLE